jgi:hypothetical protein
LFFGNFQKHKRKGEIKSAEIKACRERKMRNKKREEAIRKGTEKREEKQEKRREKIKKK